MRTSAIVVLFASLLWVGSAESKAQVPGIQELTRNIDQAAYELNESGNSLFGFQKLKMPKPFEGLLDIRFKKPQLPNFGILDKLKSIGKPRFEGEAPTTGPIMASLGKLFQPPARTSPSFLDRMFGSKPSEPSGYESVLSEADVNELSRATQGIQDHVGRMSREVKTTYTELFGGQSAAPVQPPLRSARQYSGGQTQSRY